MKNLILLALGMFFVSQITACSGIHANAGINGESFTNSRGETSSTKDWGKPGVSFTGNKTQLPALMRADADSYATKTDADTRREIALTGKYVEPSNGKYVGIKNDSAYKVYFIHPEHTGYRVPINPRSSQVVKLERIPATLEFIDDTGFKYGFKQTERLKKGDSLVLDGHKLDCLQIIKTWKDGQ